MSPSASWAKWVIPTRTEPSASPGRRSHSCSDVYSRSSGYMPINLLRRSTAQIYCADCCADLLGVLGLGDRRWHRLVDRLDVEGGQLVVGQLGGLVLGELLLRAVGE